MKKALVILMALAMVFAAFADDPAWNFGITKFDGSAELDYIIDLDAETTGMKNVKTESAIEFTLISKGEKVTTGDGLWGELKIEGGEVKNGFGSLGNVAVKTAKIHLVDGDFAVAVDILGPNLKVGGGDAKLATHSAWALPEKAVTLTGAAGFVVEISSADLFSANVSFADNGEKKSDDKKFGLKAEATIKAVPNANIYGGVAWSQEEVNGESQDLALAAKFDYTLALSDSLKLIPSVGFAKQGDAQELAAAVLLGWGGVDAEPGFAKFTNDVANVNNKCADGVSVAIKALDADFKDFGILAGAYDSTFVPGLTAGAEFATSTVDNAGFTLDVAAKYSTKFDIWDFAANAGFKLANANEETKNGLLYGASIATDGIIQNTTLKAAYAGEKAADIGGADKDGTITLSAKIHF